MNRVAEGFASVRLMAAEKFSLDPKSILCAFVHRHRTANTRAKSAPRSYVDRLTEISFHAGSLEKGLATAIFREAGFNFLDGPPIKPITLGWPAPKAHTLNRCRRRAHARTHAYTLQLSG